MASRSGPARPVPGGPKDGSSQRREAAAKVREAYRWTPPARAEAEPAQAPARIGPFQASSVLDLVFSLSGIGLGLFMFMHTSLLSSIIGGPHALDTLAGFLERYKLLQVGWPPLVVLALVHIVLSLRRAPASFRAQRLLWQQSTSLGHLDTITWAFQVASALVIGVLIAVHLYVTLTDLPITAEKAAEVVRTKLWFTIPFTLLVAGHTSIGFYRAAVKWGVVRREWAYIGLGAIAVFLMGLGYTVTMLLFRAGGQA